MSANILNRTIDHVAAFIGIWAVKRLYGPGCATDVHDDFLGEPGINCISCDAKRLLNAMKDIAL